MAKRKLSELLKELNLTPEDLEDDELGMPVTEVRKGWKNNHQGFTRASQEAAEARKQLEEVVNYNKQWQQYGQQLSSELEELRQAAATRREQVTKAGGNWRTDPLFTELVEEYDSHVQQIGNVQKQLEQGRVASQALAKGVIGMWEYIREREGKFQSWINEREVERMKEKFSDFDEEKVRAYAKEHGINTWKGAYDGWKGSRADEIKAQGRDEALREAEGKVGAPATEMGGGRPAPVSPERPAANDYDKAWGGLVSELESAGVGRT